MKVLIVSANAFSKIYNNGKTLESIFRDFQPDELSMLYTRPQDYKFTDYEFCKNLYVVSEMDIINKLIGKSKSCGGPLLQQDQNYKSDIYNKFKNKRIKNYRLLRDVLWSFDLWKNKDLDDWIDQQHADAVFLVGGGAKYLHELGLYISSKLSVPLLVFYTDDYLIHPKFRGVLGKLTHHLMKQHYLETINTASACFVIGELMSKEYGEYFNKKFYSIMNSVPVDDYVTPSKTKTLSYFGGLHLNRWNMICRIGRLLPKDWVLNVYSASELTSEIKDKFENSHVRFLGCLDNQNLKKKMMESSALLHVESDDESNRALTHLSISTKLPEYLMTGRMVIGFGPQEVASMRLLSDNNIGVSINSSQPEEVIKEILQDLLSDFTKIEKIGKQGHSYACEKFDGNKNAREFRRIVEEIIGKKSQK